MDTREVEYLLYELCTKLGFCLPPSERERLLKSPPSDVDAFTDAVFIAEGLDPVVADKRLRQQVRERVAKAFSDSIASKDRRPRFRGQAHGSD